MIEILSDEAVEFVADLNRRFRPRRNELFERVARADDFADFRTTAAYDSID